MAGCFVCAYLIFDGAYVVIQFALASVFSLLNCSIDVLLLIIVVVLDLSLVTLIILVIMNSLITLWLLEIRWIYSTCCYNL